MLLGKVLPANRSNSGGRCLLHQRPSRMCQRPIFRSFTASSAASAASAARKSPLSESAAAEKLASYQEEDLVRIGNLVIGAGVVGLAVARELSSQRQTRGTTLIVDKNRQIGMETSSRNSEVIHAGIYYPKESLRTKLCIQGKQLLYEYCKQNDIPYRNIGKLVVAQNDDQAQYLHRLAAHCAQVDVPAEIISGERVSRLEPNVRAHVALASPTTGILDSHAFMASLQRDLEESGADLALNTEVVAIQRDPSGSGYRVLVSTGDDAAPYMAVRALAVVNAAGLWADRIAAMLASQASPQTAGSWGSKYRLHFAKGRYYMYTGDAKIKVGRLIYPVPDKNITSLGTHLTIDMGGALRFGPDVVWIDSNDDYSTGGGVNAQKDRALLSDVAREVSKYLPSIRAEDLSFGYTGIRPKLQPPGGPFRDFVVKEESDSGMPGFVSLVGIESPGLTSSLAIAEMVGKLLR
ncbi:hypothetical protein GGI07_004087 [Coemansia sp. Benny D115]|nr:hypothetical protein GGI07_004087 [Coemansia sp. Benny D115]